jgi:hypothetical protein
MSITPLYTLDEINAEIAQGKKDLAAARRMLSYNRSGGQQQVQRERVEDLQKHLEWLQRQRMALEGVTGPQVLQGRVKR